MFRSRSQKYKRPFAGLQPIAQAQARPDRTDQLAYTTPIESTYQQSRMTLFCMNCGKNNHGYTQCQEPLSSYGVICFSRAENGEYQVVMVRRRHTMSYVEFLRGKYDVNGADYLVELFSGMTRAEIEFITQNPSFEVLRRDLGMDNNWKRAYKAEYDNSELKFNYILNLGILANIIRAVNHIWGTKFAEVGDQALALAVEKFWATDGKTGGARLDELQQRFNPNTKTDVLGGGTVESKNLLQGDEQSPTKHPNTTTKVSGRLEGKLYEEPEWGLPKGRRDNKETDLQCAIREFQEETQITANELTIFKNILPLEEVYVGNNGIKYRHIYFIAELTRDITDSDASAAKFAVNKEIGGVQVFDQPAALGILREHCTERRKILQKAFYIINNINYFFTKGQ